MTQITMNDQDGNPIAAKSFPNARKLFQVGSLPIAVMTWGLGNIGARTAENLLLEFGALCNRH
jgi:hypothetical protein